MLQHVFSLLSLTLKENSGTNFYLQAVLLKQLDSLTQTKFVIYIQMLQWLKVFKFLEQAIPDLKLELPAYLASANGTSNVDLQEWWV